MLSLFGGERFMQTCMILQICFMVIALALTIGTKEKRELGKTMGWVCIGSSSLLMVML